MRYLVTIPPTFISFAVVDGPGEGNGTLADHEGWQIEEGAVVEIVPDLYKWAEGAPAPRATLCRSNTDPKHYKVFNQPTDVPDEFEPTGNNFGGVYSHQRWERYVRDSIPILLKLYQVADTDPPELVDETIRSIQRVR